MAKRLSDYIKKGSKVWCLLRGEGVVKDIEKDGITVKFQSNECVKFTLDGKVADRFNQSLFSSKPTIQVDFLPSMEIGETLIATNKIDGRIFAIQVTGETKDIVMCMIGKEKYHLEKSKHEFNQIGEKIELCS